MVELGLESLAHGGEAVGHHDGLAVFVPGGVPGDRVRVALALQGRFARGRILDVLQPAPGRRASDCPLHPACGGCPWMAVPYDVQLRAKSDILRDALMRLGHLALEQVRVVPAAAAPSETRYRHRARLHAERHGVGRVLGFLPAKGRGVIPVDRCPVLEEPLERALVPVARALQRAPEGPLDVTLSCEPVESGGRVGILVETEGAPDGHRWRRVADGLWRDHGILVEVMRRGRTLARAGEGNLRYAVAPGAPGGPYEHDASCFTQGNRAQNGTLTRLALDALAPTPAEHVLELHAGCGNFTIPLAQRAGRVTSVESHPRAVEHAGRNLRRGGLATRARAFTADADKLAAVRRVVEGRVDAILLDPPRTGAPGLPAVVEQLKPRRVVYVSCNPATLARDVARVVALGYDLKSAQAVDLFPRTWHVEAVVALEAR
ncbi:MAG: class I SAM-dependent RNA methyltransferase [Deltaproteobacteria bacterium]|nr:class I SAM-dependent RNA methyltransferase [Deltaproteobacteria bacterium]